MEPQDHGPIYQETMMGRFPVEPWNTFSNLLFLLLIIYWALKVRGNYQRHPFISWSLPVLGIGYVGGTLYHATRSSDLWLYMDWMPIMILSLACAIYYFFKQRLRWYYVLLATVGPLLLTTLTYRFLGDLPLVRAVLGYPMLGFIVLFPIFRYLKRTQWKHREWVLAAMGVFLLAVFFRSIDKRIDSAWLYMGTHWLWHSLGATAVHLLLHYIYRDDRSRPLPLTLSPNRPQNQR